MFDPVNATSYHTLSPADVNTTSSQVFNMAHLLSLLMIEIIQKLALKLAQESIVLLQNNKSMSMRF